MSEILDRLRKGVQEYEPFKGEPVNAWNIGGAEDLMEEAANLISQMAVHLEDYADILDHDGLYSDEVRALLSKAKPSQGDDK